MAEFLVKAACKGRRPRHLALKHHCSRPHLVANLLRSRSVVRFLVAPAGFGKTAIVTEYCETVFRFSHVFWIEATSPCFLRDLDKQTIATTLLSIDEKPFLVIIEDVPSLDPERSRLLSEEMDRILARNCEVILTCAPLCDTFGGHLDRIKLSSLDLLLSDEEIDSLRTRGEQKAEPANLIPKQRRIASLIWGTSEEQGVFLKSVMREELSSDFLLPIFAMLVLQKGSYRALSHFFIGDNEVFSLLSKYHPYLGIDCLSQTFDTVLFEIEKIFAPFSSRFDSLITRSLFSEESVFVTRFADGLIGQGEYERACDFMRLFASRRTRASWLADRGYQLIEVGCLFPASKVYSSLADERFEFAGVLDAGESFRLALLGESVEACRLARRALRGKDVSDVLVMALSLVLSCHADCDKEDRAHYVNTSTCNRLEAKGISSKDEIEMYRDELVATCAVRLGLEVSVKQAALAWLAWNDQGVWGNSMKYAAVWIFRLAIESAQELSQQEQALQDETLKAVGQVAQATYVRMRAKEDDALGLFDALLIVAFSQACERGVAQHDGFGDRINNAADHIEASLFAQQSEYEKALSCRRKKNQAHVPSHAKASKREVVVRKRSNLLKSDPPLTVNLFGGLDVRIGSVSVDDPALRRQKVKSLLALLVLNRGREFSRDRLVMLLWPESELQTARKNFYGVWSQLKKALMAPSGTCPYLIREQQGLRLDANLLISDVMQFEEVCNTLLFERPGYGGWAHLFSVVNDKFSNDLLPSENHNEAIQGSRNMYRAKLVDALVAASTRLVNAGEAREGLWFARSALERDKAREDAYVALIEAQLGVGQRTAALETYFACRRYLTHELGIDPSIETTRLYLGIIESEEILG